MRPVRRSFLVLLGGLAAVLTHCGAPQQESVPQAGGETHFMLVCEDDEDCGAFSCICGVCTETCEDSKSCADRTANAACAINPCGTQTCDVACNEDAECSELGSSFSCLDGNCRKENQLENTLTSAGGADSQGPLTCAEAANAPALEYVDTGRLKLVQELQAGVDFEPSGEGTTALALSPDGAHLYAAVHYDDELFVFRRNAEDGTLAVTSSLGPTDGLGDYLVRPTRPVFVDAQGELLLLPALTGERLGAWSRSPESGAVVPTSSVDFSLNQWPRYVVQPEGTDFVFMTLLGSEADTVAAVVFDGAAASFGPPVMFDRAGLDTETFASPEEIVATRDGRDVYFTALNGNALHHLSFDPEDAEWTHRETVQDGEAHQLDFPGGLALSPDEHHLYVTASNSYATSVYERDCESGSLTWVESYGGFYQPYGAPSAVTLSADGKNAYVNLAGPTPGVAAYARDANTGRLKELNFVEVHPDAAFLDEILVSPDGRHVYMAHINPSRIWVFERQLE